MVPVIHNSKCNFKGLVQIERHRDVTGSFDAWLWHVALLRNIVSDQTVRPYYMK